MSLRLIKTKEVLFKTGKSRSTIWREERAGLFPMRRVTGANSVAWIESEIDQWIESRSQGFLQVSKFHKEEVTKPKTMATSKKRGRK